MRAIYYFFEGGIVKLSENDNVKVEKSTEKKAINTIINIVNTIGAISSITGFSFLYIKTLFNFSISEITSIIILSLIFLSLFFICLSLMHKLYIGFKVKNWFVINKITFFVILSTIIFIFCLSSIIIWMKLDIFRIIRELFYNHGG